MDVGRPSSYKPEYCNLVIEHMSKGFSLESFGGVVDAGKTTIYRWIQEHEEFRNAVSIASSKCQIFWEEKGIDNLVMEKGRTFSQNSWTFNMKNRFKWRDNVEVELGEETKKAIKLAYNLDDE